MGSQEECGSFQKFPWDQDTEAADTGTYMHMCPLKRPKGQKSTSNSNEAVVPNMMVLYLRSFALGHETVGHI